MLTRGLDAGLSIDGTGVRVNSEVTTPDCQSRGQGFVLTRGLEHQTVNRGTGVRVNSGVRTLDCPSRDRGSC